MNAPELILAANADYESHGRIMVTGRKVRVELTLPLCNLFGIPGRSGKEGVSLPELCGGRHGLEAGEARSSTRERGKKNKCRGQAKHVSELHWDVMVWGCLMMSPV